MSPVGCEDDSETLSKAVSEKHNEARPTNKTLCQVSVMSNGEEEEDVFMQELDPELAQPKCNSSGAISIGYPTIATAEEGNHLSIADNIPNLKSQPMHSTSTGQKGQSVSSTFAVGRMGSHWRGKTTVTKAVRQMKKVSRVPAFIPGRVLLIEEKCLAVKRHRLVL